MITIGVSFNLANPPIIDLSSANFLSPASGTNSVINFFIYRDECGRSGCLAI